MKTCKHHLTRWLLGLGLVLGLGGIPLRALAAEDQLGANHLVAIMLKTLSYDTNLKKNCPEGLRVGVMYIATDQAAKESANKYVSEFKAYKDKKVQGLAIDAVAVAATDPGSIQSGLARRSYNLLLLPPETSSTLVDWVLEATHKQAVLTFAGKAEPVERGIAFGFISRDGAPKILVNLQAADEQGAVLDSRLLRLVEVIR